MIQRHLTRELLESAREYPVVTVLGPRESGKTTLVRATFPDKPYFCLEYPDLRAAAEVDPRGFLAQARDGAVLDEVQRLPSLLSYLQGLVDEAGRPGLFILTGSHQPQHCEAISQSLAGRTAVLALWPFSVSELRQYGKTFRAFELVVKGFFPRLHEEGLDPQRFFNGYLQTSMERDLRALVNLRDLSLFHRFLTLLAGRVGQILNLSSLANDVGVSATTIRGWLRVLKASYVIFELPPFFANIRKRLIKSPKIYFTDVGLAAFLLGIRTEEQAARDPLRGNLYENLVIAEILKGALNRGLRPDVSFFRDARGNEVDLLIREAGRLIPVEIKSAATFSPHFLEGLERFQSLGLDRVDPGLVLYDGQERFQIRGIRIFNPLQAEDLWEAVTSPKEERP